jgi:hypothetical protein
MTFTKLIPDVTGMLPRKIKKWLYSYRLLGKNSLKEGAM